MRRFSLLLLTALFLTACSTPAVGESPAPSSSATASTPTVGACPTMREQITALSAPSTVTLETAQGTIRIELTTKSPIAAGNFAALAACGFYDGVVFHRIVPGFVIQGGDGQYGRLGALDPAAVGSGGPGYTIADEPVVEQYGRGVVAMARSSLPESQGSQFFIVLSDEAATPLAAYNTYAIIGRVTEGMEVVDAIAALPQSGAPSNAATPLDEAPIRHASVE